MLRSTTRKISQSCPLVLCLKIINNLEQHIKLFLNQVVLKYRKLQYNIRIIEHEFRIGNWREQRKGKPDAGNAAQMSNLSYQMARNIDCDLKTIDHQESDFDLHENGRYMLTEEEESREEREEKEKFLIPDIGFSTMPYKTHT